MNKLTSEQKSVLINKYVVQKTTMKECAAYLIFDPSNNINNFNYASLVMNQVLDEYFDYHKVNNPAINPVKEYIKNKDCLITEELLKKIPLKKEWKL